MKQFDLYLQAASDGAALDVDVVKRGYSWPAFLFAGLWALTKHLWLYGILLILVMLPLNLTSMYAAEEGPGWLWALTACTALAIAVGAGQTGNDWRRRRLVRSGFEAAGTVEARNVKEALAVASTGDERIAEARAAPQLHGGVSVGGLIVSGILFLSLIGNILVVASSDVPFLLSVTLIPAVPAVALLIRSFHPPVGFWRGLAVVFGGMCLGMSTKLIEFTLLMPGYDEQLTDLVFAAVGIALLWAGFRPVKEKERERAGDPGE